MLYLGRMMEEGPTEDALRAAAHPYTRGLLEAIPIADPAVQPARLGGRWAASCRRPRLRRAAASSAPAAPTPSTSAASRCPPGRRTARTHEVACHRWREIESGSCEARSVQARQGFAILAATMQTEPPSGPATAFATSVTRSAASSRTAPTRCERHGLRDHLAEHRQPGRLRFPHARDHAPGDDREPRRQRRLLPPEGHLPGARSRGDAAAGPRHHGRHGRGSLHRQRRQRAHRPRAARAAQRRRRSARSRAPTIRCGRRRSR